MMRRARRALLLVAFYLLTSTAPACAECAWVLWFNPEANVHIVESAHSSVTECDVALVDMRASSRVTVTRCTAVHLPATTSCSAKKAWNTSRIAVYPTSWTRAGRRGSESSLVPSMPARRRSST